MLRDDAGSDPATTSARVAVNGLPEVQAILVVVVSLIALRLTLNSVGQRHAPRAHRHWAPRSWSSGRWSIVWLIVTALIVLGMLGVNPTGLVAVLGAVGLAFSLAIQDILKNFFSGVYLLLERPFRVGDTIKVKDQQGVVENIGVRTTQLRTADNIQVLVPNAMVFSRGGRQPHVRAAADARRGVDGRRAARGAERPVTAPRVTPHRRGRAHARATCVGSAAALGEAAQAGDRFLLEGPFGAGKTTFVQGLARRARRHARRSAVRRSSSRRSTAGRLVLYHVDLYRLEPSKPSCWESLEEHLFGDGVTAVEWAERLPAELRDGATLLRFWPRTMADGASRSPPAMSAAAAGRSGRP